MPPIVPLTVSAPRASMVPALVKPFPVMLYVTEFSVTPSATFNSTPSEPVCSTSRWATGSLEQPASAPAAPNASNQMRGNLPSLVIGPDPPRQLFIDSILFVGSRPGRPLGRARTTNDRDRQARRVSY